MLVGYINSTVYQTLLCIYTVHEVLYYRCHLEKLNYTCTWRSWLNLLYKAEKPSVRLSVCLSVGRLTGNSVVSACIDVGLALHDSYVLWHVQVCFKKLLSAVVCSPER